MERGRVRVGLVVGHSLLAGWQVRVLDAVEAEGVTVATVKVVTPVVAAGRVSGSNRMGAVLRRRLAMAIDGGVEPVRVGERYAEPCTETDEADLDVVLDLREEPDDAGLSARHGTWRYVFGGERQLAPDDAFTSAALSGADAIEVRLERGGSPLRVGVFGLVPYVLRTSVGAAATSFTQWPAWCLRALADGRIAAAPFGAMPADRPSPVAAPGPAAAVGLARRLVRGLARKALWAEVWTVGLADATPAAIVEGGLPAGSRWLPERGPAGLGALWRHRGFAADPFLYRDAEGQRCLFEALDYETDRGWIAEVDIGAPAAGTRTVFRNEWHWSYPYVLEHGGETYCIPETADAAEATLHRLAPTGFEPVASLLPGIEVLDPSLVQHDGRWWLFCTRRDGPLLNTELHLFVADQLTGPYAPHPDNPVKIDAGSARPAGTIFRVDDRLYRPGQDCRGDYGAALVLHRIDELSLDRYRETAVRRFEPFAPYPAGLHTLSVGDGSVAFDAKRYAFSPPLLAKRVLGAVGRFRR